MRPAQTGSPRARPPAVSRRARQAHLRECVESRVAEMDRSPDDADQRVSSDAGGPQVAQVSRERNGEVFLRGGFGCAEGICSAGEVATKTPSIAGRLGLDRIK